MAEREGFEPPIDLRLCLISSQVHSTGLCQLSAFVTHISVTCDISTVHRFRCRTAGVRFGVPLVSRLHQSIDSRGLVFRSEMGIPHDHLERPVPEQFCDGTQIDSGHNQSTCKSMAVAMHRQVLVSANIKRVNLVRACRFRLDLTAPI